MTKTKRSAAMALLLLTTSARAQEDAMLHVDVSAYGACPPIGAIHDAYEHEAAERFGAEKLEITFACIRKAGFTVHRIVAGTEPAYEAKAKECVAVMDAYFQQCAAKALQSVGLTP